MEAYVLMLSTQNILSPAHGKPITMPSQDMILGAHYITQELEGAKGEGKIFSDIDEAKLAYDLGKIDLLAKIKVKIDGKLTETTVGRIIFNEVLPEGYKFVNEVLNGCSREKMGNCRKSKKRS